MSGVDTTCRNNRRLGRVGCGAPYAGNKVHCTRPAPWSTHPDGLCHETFSTYGTMDLHARGDRHVNPADAVNGDGDHLLVVDARGTWHQSGERPLFGRGAL